MTLLDTVTSLGRRMHARVPWLSLVDVGLVVTLLLMLTTEATVLFFHLIFVLLAVGAFTWTFREFAPRGIFWVTVTTLVVLSAVASGKTQPEEMIEIPLLSTILVLIFFVSQRRSQAEDEKVRYLVEREHIQIVASFISDVSHEFRTPLAILNTNLYLLERSEVTGKNQERVALLKEQSSQLERLVNDLVMLTRLDHLPELYRERVDVRRIVHEVDTRVRPRARDKQVSLAVTLSPDLPNLYGDPDELARALMSLVENAVQFTPAGGKVTIRANAGTEVVEIAVQDTGVGISEADLPRIFDRFYRTDRAHTTRGLGLGLPIAKKIIEAHGGTLEVESQVGQGSTFTVMLPVAPVTEDETPTTEIPRLKPRRHILRRAARKAGLRV